MKWTPDQGGEIQYFIEKWDTLWWFQAEQAQVLCRRCEVTGHLYIKNF